MMFSTCISHSLDSPSRSKDSVLALFLSVSGLLNARSLTPRSPSSMMWSAESSIARNLCRLWFREISVHK